MGAPARPCPPSELATTTQARSRGSILLARSSGGSKEQVQQQKQLAELGELELVKAAAQGLADAQSNRKIAAKGAPRYAPVEL